MRGSLVGVRGSRIPGILASPSLSGARSPNNYKGRYERYLLYNSGVAGGCMERARGHVPRGSHVCVWGGGGVRGGGGSVGVCVCGGGANGPSEHCLFKRCNKGPN